MRLLGLIVPALALLVSTSAISQTAYPDRPIKMIVPLAAASAVDVAARIVPQKMPCLRLPGHRKTSSPG